MTTQPFFENPQARADIAGKFADFSRATYATASNPTGTDTQDFVQQHAVYSTGQEQLAPFLSDDNRMRAHSFYDLVRTTDNAEHMVQAITTMLGRLVLLARATPNGMQLHAAAVSIQNGAANRPAHIAKLYADTTPWHPGGIPTVRKTLLAASIQGELPGVGEHRPNVPEVEHSLTAMYGTIDQATGQAIANGNHVNHAIRAAGKSVVSFAATPAQGALSLFNGYTKEPLNAQNPQIQPVKIDLQKTPLFWHPNLNQEPHDITVVNGLRQASEIGFATLYQQQRLDAWAQLSLQMIEENNE